MTPDEKFPEVASIVDALVRMHRRHTRLPPDVAGGSRSPVAVAVRDEAAWILHRLGYDDRVIPRALCKGRMFPADSRRRFKRRLETDGATAARVARLPGRKEAVAA